MFFRQAFCFKETAHHSSERFQAMIQGFIEVGNLIENRKNMIEAVYKQIDTAGTGFVNREEMMEFGRFMNAKFDDEKLNKLMDQMDLDKDGLISYEEFLAYFAKVGLPSLNGHANGFLPSSFTFSALPSLFPVSLAVKADRGRVFYQGHSKVLEI
jgi:hypothetical protein